MTRATITLAVPLALTLAFATAAAGAAAGGQAPAPAEKVPIVAVVGCLAEQGADWLLTNATEPEPSIANAPPAGTTIEGPTSGKNTFKLIGVSEFDLPSHKGHTMLVKALFIKAEPHARLNVTSVTMVAESCPAKSK